MERRDFLGALLAAFCGVALPPVEPESIIVVGRQLWTFRAGGARFDGYVRSEPPLGRLLRMTVEIPTATIIEIAEPSPIGWGTGELVTYSLP